MFLQPRNVYPIYWILETKTIKFKVGEEGQDRTEELPSSSVTQTREAACTDKFPSQIQEGEEITWDHMLHSHLYDPSM
mgnify:CR=1 FL=1